MDSINIVYIFTLPDEKKFEYKFSLKRDDLSLITNESTELPSWTKLSFNRCSHCTIDESKNLYCPVAEKLTGIVKIFNKIVSYNELEVVVITKERETYTKVSAQAALSSMIGLIIAVSGCPYTVFLKPMARFHLPFSTEEETILRAISMHLLKNYINNKKESAFEELTESYKNLEKLNLGIAKRLRAACMEDSAVNAVIRLDMFAKAMPFVIEEALDEIKYIFKEN